MNDLKGYKYFLEEKDCLLKDLNASINANEAERNKYKGQVHDMKVFLDQMKDALAREMQISQSKSMELDALREEMKTSNDKNRDNIGDTCAINERQKASMKSGGARMIAGVLDRRKKVQLSNAFRQWACIASTSKAVSRQMNVANEMARQLETTREKLIMLKKHFRDNDFDNGPEICYQPQFSPIETSSQLHLDHHLRNYQPITSQVSNTSSFWEFSDDEVDN